jgi:hypothetical protein
MRRRYPAGPQRPSFLVVLLDRGVLVVDVQARGDALGDHPGAEPTRGRSRSAPHQFAVEDQADLVGPAGVEVVADDVFEEHPPRDRPVQYLGQGELNLPDRDVVAVAGGPVGGGERVRQDRQPLAQQPIDLLGPEPVADRLYRGGVGAGGEPVVQCGVPDPGLGGLAFGPLVPVEAQLGVVGEVGAELEEERTEVGIHGVDVELVDHPGGAHDPRIRVAIGVTAAFGAEQRRLLLRPADEQHPLLGGESGQVGVHDVVLALALDEVDPRQVVVAGEAAHRRAERVGDLPQRGGRRDRQPELALDVADQPAGMLQLRHVHVAVHPVDAIDLEDHVIGEDIGDTAGYGHHWTPVGRAASRPTNRFERFIHRAGPAGHGLRADRSPPTLLTTARLVGLGRSPVR